MNFENNCQNYDSMPINNETTMPQMGMMQGCMTNPIYECPEEKVCHRYICYEVPHIKPCNTRIINHHVYRHTFSPCNTCCEENVVENIYDRNCCIR